MIDVVALGTGAMVPLPDRWLSSFLIRTGGSLVLLDCGEGTQISMRQRGWGFRKLDTICLSHLHADHVAGIPGLLHTVGNAGRREPIEILGPAGTARVVDGLSTIAADLPYEVRVRELAPGDAASCPGRLHLRVEAGLHRVPVLGYRFDLPRAPRFEVERAWALNVPVHAWSRLQRGEDVEVDGEVIRPAMVLGPPRAGLSLGFLTDTRPLEKLAELMRGVDLLIIEGTYGDDADLDKAMLHRHMTFREAAALARGSGAKHVWLTHFSAAMEQPERWLPNAMAEHPDVTVAREGLSARLNFDTGYDMMAADEDG